MQFITLFALWIILCGFDTVEKLIWGVVGAGITTFFTNDLIYPYTHTAQRKKTKPYIIVPQLYRLLCYLPWLLLALAKANIQVAYTVLHIRMPIDPVLLRFRTTLHSEAAQVTLANSITLTPGTVTIDLKEGEYYVHALAPQFASSLLDGEMQNRVAAIYRYEKQEKPEVIIGRSIEEVEQWTFHS